MPVPRGAGMSWCRCQFAFLGEGILLLGNITYTDGDGTALARLLDGNGVRLTKVAAPVTATDGDNVELGDDDGGADGGSDFLGGLDTETDVTLTVTDENDGLEAGTLTGTGLLLDGLDLCFTMPISSNSLLPPYHCVQWV